MTDWEKRIYKEIQEKTDCPHKLVLDNLEEYLGDGYYIKFRSVINIRNKIKQLKKERGIE